MKKVENCLPTGEIKTPSTQQAQALTGGYLTSSHLVNERIPTEFPAVFPEARVPGPSALLRCSYLPRRYFPHVLR
jgi:hypothetical protein